MSRFDYGDFAGDCFDLDDPRDRRRRRRSRHTDDEPHPRRADRPVWDETAADPELPAGAARSTYQESRSRQGPQPPPRWLITSAAAHDYDHGVVRTGKEADIHLVERTDPATGATCHLASKRYRSHEHRMFHRDAGYLEGRRVRRSRENRAIANRTAFGREIIAAQWAVAEFAILGRLWSAGVAVPYPVQLCGTQLWIEFLGDADGTAAPQLAELRPGATELDDLWGQCHDALVGLASIGFTHGDLSAYNVLVHDGRLVLIDLPQAVDIVGNPQGPALLWRDCTNICRWFASRGHRGADAAELANDVGAAAGL